MTTHDAPRARWSREARLLTITVVLSALVLLLLARLRFPAAQRIELPTQPLERLAARAAYDDLSRVMMRASELVLPWLEVLEAPQASPGATLLRVEDMLNGSAAPARPALALGYRFGPTRAVALTSLSRSQAAGLTRAGASERPGNVHQDAARGVVVSSVPEPARVDWRPLALARLDRPQYLLLAEATPAGPSVRPLFASVPGTVTDPRWNEPLPVLGPDLDAAHGSLLFTLEGAFVGAVAADREVPAIVPAEALVAAGRRAVEGAGPVSTIGVTLQPLTPRLARASGARTGAMVVEVDPGGPAAAVLVPGDVITAVGGAKVTSPPAALRAVMRAAPGRPIPIEVHRNGRAERTEVVPVALRSASASAGEGPPLGLTLRRAGGGARVVRVAEESAAARAGIRPGDVITWAGQVRAPTPAQVTGLFDGLAPDEALLIGLERDGRSLVVGVDASEEADGLP